MALFRSSCCSSSPSSSTSSSFSSSSSSSSSSSARGSSLSESGGAWENFGFFFFFPAAAGFFCVFLLGLFLAGAGSTSNSRLGVSVSKGPQPKSAVQNPLGPFTSGACFSGCPSPVQMATFLPTSTEITAARLDDDFSACES